MEEGRTAGPVENTVTDRVGGTAEAASKFAEEITSNRPAVELAALIRTCR